MWTRPACHIDSELAVYPVPIKASWWLSESRASKQAHVLVPSLTVDTVIKRERLKIPPVDLRLHVSQTADSRLGFGSSFPQVARNQVEQLCCCTLQTLQVHLCCTLPECFFFRLLFTFTHLHLCTNISTFYFLQRTNRSTCLRLLACFENEIHPIKVQIPDKSTSTVTKWFYFVTCHLWE